MQSRSTTSKKISLKRTKASLRQSGRFDLTRLTTARLLIAIYTYEFAPAHHYHPVHQSHLLRPKCRNLSVLAPSNTMTISWRKTKRADGLVWMKRNSSPNSPRGTIGVLKKLQRHWL